MDRLEGLVKALYGKVAHSKKLHKQGRVSTQTQIQVWWAALHSSELHVTERRCLTEPLIRKITSTLEA